MLRGNCSLQPKWRWWEVIKSILANLLLRPSGMAELGEHARIGWPRRLRGREHIRVGRRTTIDAQAWIEAITTYRGQSFEPRIVIGDDVAIGRHATITAIANIAIGEGSLLSEGVYISDHVHDVLRQARQPLVSMPLKLKGEVLIGPRCFLGFRASVLGGVQLGEQCVVGAHAVVTKSFGPGCVLAGVPARLIGMVEE